MLHRFFPWCVLPIALACGVPNPEVKRQSSTNLESPQWADPNLVLRFNYDGAHLVSFPTDNKFDGSLVIWDENADPSKMSKVLDFAEKSKGSKNDYLLGMEPIAGLEHKLERKEKQLAEKIIESNKALKTDYYKNNSSEIAASSQKWIETKIATDKQNQFEAYCDARLLDFARSEFLLNNVFTSRPEPLAVCGLYYRTKGMFASPLCTNVTDSNPGNYFRCIWEDGVFKTFVLLEEKQPATSERKAEFFEKISELKVFVGQKSNDGIFKTIGSLNKPFRIGLANERWKPNQIKTFLAKTAEEFTDEPLLANKFSELTKLRASNHTRDDDKKQFTLNDRIFNFHLISNEVNIPGLVDEDKKDLEKGHNDLPELFGKAPKIIDPTVEDRATLEQMILFIKKEIEKRKSAAAKHQRKYMEEFDKESGALMKNSNLAKLLLSQVYLEMNPLGKLVSVSLTLKEKSKTLVGCFDWDSGRSIACPPALLVPELLKVSLVRDTGLLTIDVPLSNPDGIGLKVSAKNEDTIDFQLIPKNQIENKTLHFELYPRPFREHLQLITGTVQIKSGHRVDFQGSLTLTTKVSKL